MDIIGTHYKLNMYLLGAIGLWPYTSKKIRKIQTTLVSSFLWGSIFCQLLPFVTIKYTMHLFLKNAPALITAMAYTLKYVTFWYQTETVEYLMEQIQSNCNSLNVEMELSIIEKRNRMGKYYTQVFALFSYSAMLIVILMQLLPDILNVVKPLNQSRPHEMLFTLELFLDEQKYFYLLALAMSITIFAGATTFIATEGIFFMWLQHAVSLFEIVRIFNLPCRHYSILYSSDLGPHRTQVTVTRIFAFAIPEYFILAAHKFHNKSVSRRCVAIWYLYELMKIRRHKRQVQKFINKIYRIKETVTPNPRKRELCANEFNVPTFANAMEMHKRALKCHHCIQRKFVPSYLILMLLGILSLSFNLLRLSQLFKSLAHISDLLITGMLIMAQLAYMYYLSYVLQQLSDSSSQIFRDSYNTRWYEAPVDTQKQLLFIMSCNVEGVNLNMYGFFDSSIEGFATLIRISVSYFMALRSIR